MASEQVEVVAVHNGSGRYSSSKKLLLKPGDRGYPLAVGLFALFFLGMFGTIGALMIDDLRHEDMSKLLSQAIVIALFVIGFSLWGRRSERKREKRRAKRRAELAQFVQGRGWSYTPSVEEGGDRYAGVGPLPTLAGSAHLDIWDSIAGEHRGRTFCCFQYRTRGMGTDLNDKKMYFYTFFAVTAPASAPRMAVRERAALDKFAARLFGEGQVVELGIPAFDEEFRVVTDDEAFARNVMSGHLAQFLPSDPRAKAAPLEFNGNELVTWCSGTWSEGTLGTQDIQPRLDYLCDVLDRVPAQVWR